MDCNSITHFHAIVCNEIFNFWQTWKLLHKLSVYCFLACIFPRSVVKYIDLYSEKGGICLKRIAAIVTVLILLGSCLCISASAESAASSVNLMCTVTSEGDCIATMTVNLRLEENLEKLYFPLPLHARNITLNGSQVSTTRSAAATLVDISKLSQGYQGELALRFEYTLPEAVRMVKYQENEKAKPKWQMQMDIPLLSGFDYPVESLNFTITMPPGKMTHRPSLTSIYRQASIESDIPFQVAGSQIIGASKTVLNDHEGVTLTMVVPEEMFPTVSTYVREGNPELPYIIAFAVLAMAYWLLTLRTWPIIRSQATTPPEGITAGELGCRLTLSGGDLTMMVFSWAQLGYLYLSQEKDGRILLHKRMDMGNERSQFENRIYKMLFGVRQTVDATGYTYAKLVRKVAGIVPQERHMYIRNSGNMKIFRALACLCQVFCGVCVAMNMTGVLPIAILLAIILIPFSLVSAWLLQDVAYRTHLRGKVPVFIGFVCMLIWILLGLLCGQVWIPLGCAFGQWVYGYFAAYGGRRSASGRHDAGQVLGLRHYVKHLPKQDVGRFLKNDPDFYFNYAPYALALGVINPYSRNFRKRKIGSCPYLILQETENFTPEDWGHILKDTAQLMDDKAKQMQLQRWFAVRIRTKPQTRKRR